MRCVARVCVSVSSGVFASGLKGCVKCVREDRKEIKLCGHQSGFVRSREVRDKCVCTFVSVQENEKVDKCE